MEDQWAVTSVPIQQPIVRQAFHSIAGAVTMREGRKILSCSYLNYEMRGIVEAQG